MASGRLALRGLGPGSDDRCLSARAWAAAFAGKEKEKELPVRFDYGGNGTNGQSHVTLRKAVELSCVNHDNTNLATSTNRERLV